MIVLDTHVWLWSLDVPQRLSRAARRAIDGADRVGVCTSSVFELSGLALKGRLRLDIPLRDWVRSALAQENVESLPLTPDLGLDAAQLRCTGDPIDRIIYATARAEDARLLTRDERLLQLRVGDETVALTVFFPRAPT